jgi:uncharacterized heparinase superfamily protein
VISFSRYLHTLRYLKPRQIYRRLWFRLVQPRIDEKQGPPLRCMPGSLVLPARRRTSLLDAETFFFLNQTGALSSLGWDNTGSMDSISKLWRYNQHYFDDLNSLDAVQRSEWHQKLLQRWVAENPPGVGVGWDPYPASLRIVNWVKWHGAGHILCEACVQSLAVQARWLVRRIEWHILGNHLFANAKALVFAGLFFSGDEADRWLSKGLKIIANELPEQVLSDGANFERSPMYHAIFLEDLLDLFNLTQDIPGIVPEVDRARWLDAAKRMLHWLEGMTHPDGEIAFFNDGAIGIAPSPRELFSYARRLGVSFEQVNSRVTHFIDSGYIRLASRDALAILDVAKIGPNYLPGHAHADTLSFELSLFGQRVMVNGGTSEYGTGPVRQFERSTAAHNTVVVNGENSSEVWGGFRVARRAFPRELEIKEVGDSVIVSCAHDGYRRLRGSPMHRRTWHFSETSLVLTDQIEGRFDHAFAYFHLHPSIAVFFDDFGTWALQLPQGQRVSVLVESGESWWVQSQYSPEFGQKFPTHCLKVALGKKGARVRFDWSAIE